MAKSVTVSDPPGDSLSPPPPPVTPVSPALKKGMSVSLNLTGTTHELLQAIFTAQMATQLLTLKALVDHGIVSGDALLEAMAKTADEMSESPLLSSTSWARTSKLTSTTRTRRRSP